MNEQLEMTLFESADRDKWRHLPADVLWTRWLTALQSIAQTGLTFSQDNFDKERYTALLEIASQMATQLSPKQYPAVQDLFFQEKGYATPKIDVRGAIFRSNKILLVQEKSDQCWSLPGGWADVNQSPKEAIIKEIKEEAGYKARVLKLLALFDKSKHDHPPQWPHTYKCFFLCEIVSGEGCSGLETSAIGFFERDALPPLSTHRVTATQIERCFEHYANPDWPTDFD